MPDEFLPNGEKKTVMTFNIHDCYENKKLATDTLYIKFLTTSLFFF